MKKFGLSLVGMSLISTVSTCAGGEIVLSDDIALIDEFVLSFIRLVDSLSECFQKRSCSVDDPCFINKEKNLSNAIQRFLVVRDKVWSISKEEGFDAVSFTGVVDGLLCYSEVYLPLWLRDKHSLITTDENKVPFRYRGRYRSVLNILKSLLWL